MGGQAAPTAKPSISVTEVLITIIILVFDVALTAIVSLLGFFIALMSDSCGPQACNVDLIGAGMWVSVLLPWVVLVVIAGAAIMRLVQRRSAWRIPLLGVLAVVGAWLIGPLLAAVGMGMR
jgi:hypothetical protein